MQLDTVGTVPGSCGMPLPFFEMKVLQPADEETGTAGGAELPVNEQGSIAIKLPMPPGFMTTLYKNDARYKEAYLEEFPGMCLVQRIVLIVFILSNILSSIFFFWNMVSSWGVECNCSPVRVRVREWRASNTPPKKNKKQKTKKTTKRADTPAVLCLMLTTTNPVLLYRLLQRGGCWIHGRERVLEHCRPYG